MAATFTGAARLHEMADADDPQLASVARSRVARGGWLVLGLTCVGIGAVGVVVPGLPTTVFFIVAAWAFSKSSPRLEAWVLGLPRIGPLVQDHRDGLGMPRRAKVMAISMVVVFVALSSWLVDSRPAVIAVVAAGVIGVVYIGLRVPTKEAVLARRSA
jgi:uncharacterized membrane protein YbaN (DUF454 family)